MLRNCKLLEVFKPVTTVFSRNFTLTAPRLTTTDDTTAEVKTRRASSEDIKEILNIPRIHEVFLSEYFLRGKYNEDSFENILITELRGQGLLLNGAGKPPQMLFDAEKDVPLELDVPKEKNGQVELEIIKDDNWMGLISYDDSIVFANIDKCNDVLGIHLDRRTLMNIKFPFELVKKVHSTPHELERGIFGNKISYKAQLADLFEKMATESWIEESMAFVKFKYSWDPIKCDFVRFKDVQDGKMVAPTLHGALIIVSKGTDGKLYPFAIPAGSRDPSEGVRDDIEATSECIPLCRDIFDQRFVKKEKHGQQWHVIEANLCPRLAVELPPECVSQLYQNPEKNHWELNNSQWTWQSRTPDGSQPRAELRDLTFHKSGKIECCPLHWRMSRQTTSFNDCIIKHGLKPALKQMIIKCLSFHCRINNICIGDECGGLSSVDDLNGENYNEYIARRRDEDKLEKMMDEAEELEKLID